MSDKSPENPEKKVIDFGEMDAVVTCAVGEYDVKNNDLCGEKAKSYPRDLHCVDCKRQVVMSNGAFERYESSEKKPPIKCMTCFVKMFEDGELTIPN